VLVVGGGATGIVLATTGKKDHKAQKSATPTASAPTNGSSGGGFPSSGGESSGSGFPSSGGASSGGSGSAPSESEARTVAERYLADINKSDKNDARTLICAAAKPSWESSASGPGGDFTVHVDKVAFSKSAEGSEPDSIDVTYNLDVSSGSQHNSSELTFTVVDEDGAKICGEK